MSIGSGLSLPGTVAAIAAIAVWAGISASAVSGASMAPPSVSDVNVTQTGHLSMASDSRRQTSRDLHDQGSAYRRHFEGYWRHQSDLERQHNIYRPQQRRHHADPPDYRRRQAPLTR